MIRIIKNIDEVDTQQWAVLIADSKEGSFFQSEAFYYLAEASKGFEPHIIQAYDDQKLVGSLLSVKIKESNSLKGYFSSRTVIYAGPIISDIVQSKVQIVNSLLSALCTSQRSSIFIQFRNFHDLSEYREVFEKHEFSLRDRLNFLVKLDSFNAVWKRMSANRRRQIKASPVFCVLCPASCIDQVKKFYDILHNLYRHKVRKPLPAWSFFESFYNMTLETPENGIILLVMHDADVIGGILCPISPGKTIYEWYVCGLDEQYKELSPSTLATWAAMDYGLKNKIPQFDFMGVGVPNKPYGVREFKRRFGGEIENFGRYSRINNKILYAIAEAGYNLLALLNRI